MDKQIIFIDTETISEEEMLEEEKVTDYGDIEN